MVCGLWTMVMSRSLLVMSACAGAAALSTGINGAMTHSTARIAHPIMQGFGAPTDKRKDVAKARRAVLQDGGGGMKTRAKAKRSEQKKPVSGKGFGNQGTGQNYDRRPKGTAICACGTGQMYQDCCGPEHDGADAKTPEALVRARYSAYAYRLPDFLMRTTDPQGAEYDADAAAWKRGLLGFCVRAAPCHPAPR